MTVFYVPSNAYVGDVIPFFDDGLFKPFYLKILARLPRYRSCGWLHI
jgi:hypothetical protein